MSTSKYRQLFQFLKDFNQLGEKTTRDITTSNKYHFSLHPKDLARATGLQYFLLSPEKEDQDFLLRMRRPKKPTAPLRPTPSTELLPYLDGLNWNPKQMPFLRSKLKEEVDFQDVSDQHHINSLFEKWIKKYKAWQDHQRTYLEQKQQFIIDQKIYGQLFDAQAKMNSFGERFELVLNTGFFVFQELIPKKEPEAYPSYYYPIITTFLQVEMDEKGTMSLLLKPSERIFHIQTEGFGNLPDLQIPIATATLDTFISQMDGEFPSCFFALQEIGLRQFANELGSDLEYRDEIDLQREDSATPVIYFAPIISFKNRSSKHFTKLFEKIIEALENGFDQSIPLLDQLLGIQPKALSSTSPKLKEKLLASDNIIFPKKSNQEQLSIAKEVADKDIVVVQGAPGTGKSHTIANIICRLLSEGNRVLVTAHTDQALKALKNHLPPEFIDLVIYFLGGEGRRNEGLDKSIKQLQNSINDYNPDRAAERLQLAASQIQMLESKREELVEIISIKINADQTLATLNDRYKEATLTHLARKIGHDAVLFSWFKEPVIDLERTLRRTSLFLEWFNAWNKTRKTSKVPVGDLRFDRLLTPDDFKTFLLLNNDLEDQEWQSQYAFLELDIDHWDRQLTELQGLLPLSMRVFPPFNRLAKCFADRPITYWVGLKETSIALIEELKALGVLDLFTNYLVHSPPEIDVVKLKADAQEICNYTLEGKKLNSWPSFLLPKNVKDRNYIYKSCSVNGFLCNDSDSLNILLKYAKVVLIYIELDERWGEFKVEESRPKYKLEAYENHLQEFLRCLEFLIPITEITQELNTHLLFPFDHLEEDGMLSALQHEMHQLKRMREWREKGEALSVQKKYLILATPTPPLGEQLLVAMAEQDIRAYRDIYKTWQDLDALLQLKEQTIELEVDANSYFEQTISHLKEQPSLSSKLNDENLTNAVYWSHAKTRLLALLEDSLKQTYVQLSELEENSRAEAAKYLKVSALRHLMDRVSHGDRLNSQLGRWKQAVTQARGSGKRALRYSMESQRLLREISYKIPCWVIPIYKLVETLGPEPEIFDVVIVDEASQLGPEALFLNYIAKKMIVVGDDQQTAPEYVGIEAAKVSNLIKRHLNGIPDMHFFDTKNSFFDHAKSMTGRQIVLREHFRCVPDIIEFSNQLAYRPAGISLIPLKQQPLNGLPPLATLFVPNGENKNNVNVKEAEMIITAIVFCLTQKEYKGKSVGVISLHGDKQNVLIAKLIHDKVPMEEIRKRQIRVGVPPDFQGDERDVIFLSMVISKHQNFTSLTKASYKRRFNVAMSRAKEQVFLCHSIDKQLLKGYDFRYQLIQFFEQKQKTSRKPPLINLDLNNRHLKPPLPFDSWFEVDIYQEIISKGYTVIPKFQIGPYHIDLVVEGKKSNKRIAVECVGDILYSEEQLKEHIQHQLILERAGWEFFRIRYAHYLCFPAQSLLELWKLL